MHEFNSILSVALKPTNLFGIHIYELTSDIAYSSTRAFEIEILREGGVIGFVLFIAFVVVAFETFSRYLKDSKDQNYLKVVLLTILVSFVLYSTFCADVRPITHHKTSYYLPITRSLPFLLMVFIVGFTVLPKGKSEIAFDETPSNKPVKNKKQHFEDDDYAFNDVEEEEII